MELTRELEIERELTNKMRESLAEYRCHSTIGPDSYPWIKTVRFPDHGLLVGLLGQGEFISTSDALMVSFQLHGQRLRDVPPAQYWRTVSGRRLVMKGRTAFGEQRSIRAIILQPGMRICAHVTEIVGSTRLHAHSRFFVVGEGVVEISADDYWQLATQQRLAEVRERIVAAASSPVAAAGSEASEVPQ